MPNTSDTIPLRDLDIASFNNCWKYHRGKTEVWMSAGSRAAFNLSEPPKCKLSAMRADWTPRMVTLDRFQTTKKNVAETLRVRCTGCHPARNCPRAAGMVVTALRIRTS
jgi:hypothetical protein